MNRVHGSLTFHLTQILTGHGCFGTFLFRIGKVTSPVCEHCASGEADSAEHTLQSCIAWDLERTELVSVVGANLTLAGVIEEISLSRDAWGAFSHFAGVVMRKKEEAERRKQSDILPPPLPVTQERILVIGIDIQ